MSKGFLEQVRAYYATDTQREKYRARAEDGLLAWERNVATRYFVTPGSILDLGCGAGREAFALEAMGHSVAGVDTDESMVAAARANAVRLGKAAEFRTFGGRYVVSGNNMYNYAVLWSQVLANVPGADNRLALLRECARVLRPAGLLSLSVHDRDASLPVVIEKGLVVDSNDPSLEDGDLILREDGSPECYWHYFTEDEIRRLCKAAGFTLLESGLASAFGQDDWDTIRVYVCQLSL